MFWAEGSGLRTHGMILISQRPSTQPKCTCPGTGEFWCSDTGSKQGTGALDLRFETVSLNPEYLEL